MQRTGTPDWSFDPRSAAHTRFSYSLVSGRENSGAVLPFPENGTCHCLPLGRREPRRRARPPISSRAPGYGLRMLDLFHPLRDPSVTVALVLTFVEEVGQHDSWWWLAIVAFFNLLVVRLVVHLVTLAVLGCLHLLRLVPAR